MPRRLVLRRTTGVLAAAALIATAATAISVRGLPARSITGVARAASPSPPGTLLAQMRIVLPSAKAARAALRAAETQPGVPAAPSRAVPGAVHAKASALR